MKKHILVIIDHSFYLYLLKDVIRKLSAGKKFEVVFVTLPKKKIEDDLKRLFPTFKTVYGFDRRWIDLFQPKLIITLQIWWLGIRPFLEEARKGNIPILMYDHGSLLYPCEYGLTGDEYATAYRADLTLCSHAVCWGNTGRDAWKSYGAPPEKMHVTGAVQLDPVIRAPALRKDVYSKLGIPEDKKILLFFSCFHYHDPKWNNRMFDVLGRLDRYIQKNEEYRLVIKPHPMERKSPALVERFKIENATYIANAFEENRDDCIIVDSADVIKHSFAILSYTSSAVITPISLGVPVIHVEVDTPESKYFSQLGKDVFINLNKGHRLDAALKKAATLLENTGNKAHGKFASRLNYNNDGKAVERLVQLILQIIAKQEQETLFYPLSIEQEHLESVGRFPHLPYPLQHLIHYYGRTGNLDAARKWFNSYSEAFNDHDEIFRCLHRYYFENGTPEQIIEFHDANRQRISLNPRLKFQTAINFRLKKLIKKALEIFEEFLEFPPYAATIPTHEIEYESGLAFLENGDIDKAVKYFKRALKKTSKNEHYNYRILFRLGLAYFRLNNFELSMVYLDRCLEACPNHKAARKIRNQLPQQSLQPVPLSRQKRKDLFIEKPALTQNPHDHQLASLYGSYYFEHIHTWDNAFSKMFNHKEPLCSKEDNILLMGCCFASVLKRELIRRGYNAVDFPGEERYTTFSIEQEFKRLLTANSNENQAQTEVWQLGDNSYASSRMKYVFGQSPETVMEKTRQVEQTFSRRLREADVLLIAFGLTEGWRDKNSKEVYVQLPFPQVLNLESMEHFTSGFKENLETMERIYRLIIDYTHAKPVFCISPVPLHATFTAIDCIEADADAKAILRTAIFELKRQYKSIRYFPAYEALMYNLDNQPFFKKDKRHVNNSGIKRIGELFSRMYLKPE